MMKNAKPALVIIEDDPQFREQLCSYLGRCGYAATGMASAEEFFARPDAGPFDIAVIDIVLPGLDGFALCRKLRQESSIGIIMLTGLMIESENRVHGLRLGADYYLAKPVNLVELIATIDSLFRRLTQVTAQAPQTGRAWQLDPTSRQLVAPNGQFTRLTPSELNFLTPVVRRAGKLVPRPAVVEALNEDPARYDYGRMDTLVRRLRQKITARTGLSLPLETVHGQGYVFTAKATAAE